jgi:hypothetical protein
MEAAAMEFGIATGGVADELGYPIAWFAEHHFSNYCFSFKVGRTPHTAAMRSMELMIAEVKPRVDKALS